MQEVFGLPTELLDLRWKLAATLRATTISLEECQPHRLKDFGDLDFQTATELCAVLQSLAGLLEAISSEAEK